MLPVWFCPDTEEKAISYGGAGMLKSGITGPISVTVCRTSYAAAAHNPECEPQEAPEEWLLLPAI